MNPYNSNVLYKIKLRLKNTVLKTEKVIRKDSDPTKFTINLYPKVQKMFLSLKRPNFRAKELATQIIQKNKFISANNDFRVLFQFNE